MYYPKLLLLTGILLLASLFAQAQTLFTHTKTLPEYWGPNALRRVVQAQDGNLLLAGNDLTAAYLAKVNTCGDTLWRKTFRYGCASTLIQLEEILELPNGELVLGGICHNCCPVDSSSSAVILIQCDGMGDTLQTHYFGLPQYPEGAPRLALAANGTRIALSYRQSTDFNVTWTGDEAVITLFDLQLNTIWSDTFHLSFFDAPKDIAETPDGGFVVAGHGHNDIYEPKRLWLMKVDAQGNLLWHARFDSLMEAEATAMQVDVQGRIVVIGHAEYQPGTEERQIMLARVLDQGSSATLDRFVRWGHPLFQDEGHSIQAISNGGYLLAGIDGEIAVAHFSRGWIARADSNLHISPPQYVEPAGMTFEATQLFDIAPLDPAGNSYVAVGNVNLYNGVITIQQPCTLPVPVITILPGNVLSVNAQGYHVQWYFQGNPVGTGADTLQNIQNGLYTVSISQCGSSNCQAYTSIVSREDPSFPLAVQVYPNPATDLLNVRLDVATPQASYTMLDVLGRSIMEGTLKAGNNTLDLSHLPQGVFLLSMQTATQKTTVRVVHQ